MDRRQRKTRNAIFSAFLKLLSKKDFSAISVQEIIDEADIGRATFYAHFETKDYLLKAICEELFRHIGENKSSHYSDCTQSGDIFLHLLKHFENNDDHILKLLTSPNNALFLEYFKSSLRGTVENNLIKAIDGPVPRDFLVNHITSSVVEAVLWWAKNGKKEPTEKIAQYLNYILPCV